MVSVCRKNSNNTHSCDINNARLCVTHAFINPDDIFTTKVFHATMTKLDHEQLQRRQNRCCYIVNAHFCECVYVLFFFAHLLLFLL